MYIIKKIKKISTTIIALIIVVQSFAADSSKYIISTKFINIENGLAARQVVCGMQDSKGFIWIGTTHGLQRYDGKNFITFTKEKNGLQDNIISKIIEHEEQHLWIMYGLSDGYAIPSSNKIDILDLKTNTIQSFASKFKNKLPFAQEDAGIIYTNNKKEFIFLIKNSSTEKNEYNIVYNYSIYYYSKKKGFIKTNKNTYILYDNDNFYFKGDSLITIDKDKLKVFDLVSKNLNENINHYQNPFYVNENKEVFFFKQNSYQLSVLPTETKKNKNITIPINFNTNQTLSSKYPNSALTSTLYLNNKQEFFIFNGKQNIKIPEINIWIKNENIKVYNFFTSSNNIHWICTSNGLYQIDIKENNFTHLLSNDSYKLTAPTNYQNRNIYSLGKNNFIFNSWGGTYNIKKNKNQQWEYLKIAILSDKTEYYGGSFFDGTNFYKKGETGLKQYNIGIKETNIINSCKEYIWGGIKVNKECFIIASSIKVFNINALKETKPLLFCDGTVAPDNWINQFYFTKDSTLWAVGNNGIFTINNNGCVTNYYISNSIITKNIIPYNDVNGIFEDAQGILWVATNGGGLIKWNRKNNRFTKFTDKDGLSTNVLYGILEDGKNQLWISSDYGLMRFNTNTNFIKTYTTKDGITNNEFNRCSFTKAQDGQLLFGGMNGVNAFYPSAFYSDTVSLNAPFSIISFQKFSGKKNTLQDETIALLETNKITLQPNDNLCIIQFQLLDYEIGEHKYAYKIDGIDNDWNYINDNTLRLSSLPYGDYILKIKGQNQEGEWNINELKITVEVIKPFYKKWWFITLMVICFIALIYTFIKYRTYSLEKEKNTLENTVNLRTNQLNKSLQQKEILLKEIHHRVKNNLSVIGSLLELQANNIIDVKAKEALQESQNRVGSIALIHQRLYQHENLGAIDVKEFMEDMYKHIATVFYNKKNIVTTNFDVKNIQLDIDTAVPLGLIINELLTNSFKYGFTANKAGEIDIQLFQNPNGNYLLTYKDNGLGVGDTFALQKNNTLGFKLIKSLAKQLSGKAEYVQQDNQSLFTLQFKNILNRNDE